MMAWRCGCGFVGSVECWDQQWSDSIQSYMERIHKYHITFTSSGLAVVIIGLKTKKTTNSSPISSVLCVYVFVCLCEDNKMLTLGLHASDSHHFAMMLENGSNSFCLVLAITSGM